MHNTDFDSEEGKQEFQQAKSEAIEKITENETGFVVLARYMRDDGQEGLYRRASIKIESHEDIIAWLVAIISLLDDLISHMSPQDIAQIHAQLSAVAAIQELFGGGSEN